MCDSPETILPRAPETLEVRAGLEAAAWNPRAGIFWQGGTFAAPIFKQFVQETRARWKGIPFQAPEGIRMVRIDRVSGKRVFGGTLLGD